MSDAVQRLAIAAGLLPHWHNFEGREQTVAADVLRAVLAAMQLDASSESACAASLAELKAEQESTLPALLITRIDQRLRLPDAVASAAAGTVQLVAEEAPERAPLTVSVRQDGDVAECDFSAAPPGYYRLQAGELSLRLALAPARCRTVTDVTDKARAWGLAVQLYALREAGDAGIGSFEALARLAAAAAAFGADALAISPVHALFAADVQHHSPYSPSSRLFLNPLYVDVQQALTEFGVALAAEPALAAEARELETLSLIDWPRAATLRWRLLRRLWRHAAKELLNGNSETARAFRSFRDDGGAALEHHARFEALHRYHFERDSAQWHWQSWSAAYATPTAAGVETFAADHADEVAFHIFVQWLADRSMAAAQAAAEQAGMKVGLIADLAVGTDSGGSHAWSFQEDILIGVAVGAPPDLLNTRGQNWGLTTFSPRALRQHGFQPFIDMLRASLRHARGVRIDHILGLRRLWVIPDGFEDGVYLQYPLEEMLALVALESWRHSAVVCGEDLGTVPPGLREALATAGVLGMRVLWFERDHGLFIEPARWSDSAMAVTTTHDLPTVAGWWLERDIDWRLRAGQISAAESDHQRIERKADREALWNAFSFAHAGDATSRAQPEVETVAVEAVVDAAIEFVARTPAPLTIIPLEDIAGLEEQPNLPATTDQHPNWRRRLPCPAPALLQEPANKARLQRLQQARKPV